MADAENTKSLCDSPEVDGLIESYFVKQVHDLASKRRTIPIDELPLARVKRIMKQDSCDPHPRMISADATPFMALAAQLFIGSLTNIAWTLFTQKAKKNTLQLKDLKDAVAASSKFDFLADIVDIYDDQKRQETEVQRRLENGLGVISEMSFANQQCVRFTHRHVPEQGRAQPAAAATEVEINGAPNKTSHEELPVAVHSSCQKCLPPFNLNHPPQSIPAELSAIETNDALDEENILSRLESLPEDLMNSLDVEFDESEVIRAALAGDDW